jgi:YD repeat-containing protein
MAIRIALVLSLLGVFFTTPTKLQAGCYWGQIAGISGDCCNYLGEIQPNWTAQVKALESERHVPLNNCVYGPSPFYAYCSFWAWVGTTCSPPTAQYPPENGTGQPCPACSGGRPINLANGNTYIQEADVRIPGLGGGLTVERTWNSLWPPTQSGMIAGLFGNRWRSTYEERVFQGSDGTMKYARSDGSFWSFWVYNGPGYILAAPTNQSATLIFDGSNWTVTFANGEQRIFDGTSGDLTSIIDRNGNTTQLTYDSIGRLTTVTDPVSRHLYFAYPSDTSLLVSAITSDVGVSTSYSYDSDGRLTTATEPDGSTLSFAYNSNSMITSVTDSEGKIIESHTYDSAGRGLTSSRADGVEALTVTY